MELKQAKEINGAMVSIGLHTQGIFMLEDEKIVELIDMLKAFNLKSLLEAVEVVDKANKEARQKGEETGKGYSIDTICADRLVSAIYTALNFESYPCEGSISPMVQYPMGCRNISLCLISSEK